jgi:hypothetical protein
MVPALMSAVSELSLNIRYPLAEQRFEIFNEVGKGL